MTKCPVCKGDVHPYYAKRCNGCCSQYCETELECQELAHALRWVVVTLDCENWTPEDDSGCACPRCHALLTLNLSGRNYVGTKEDEVREWATRKRAEKR